ncbi:MAG: lamin tail domain-containing protein [Bacteroidota bacterium]
MYRSVLFLLILSLPFVSAAQLQEDFSDGELSNNPQWLGQPDSFVVNSSLELQLNASAAGNAGIYTPVTIADSASWEIYIRLAFAPSSSNKVRIYLQADQPFLGMASGYFIEIGEQGSDDAVRLFRQDLGEETELARGSAATVGSDPVELRLQVRRNSLAEWIVLTDLQGGNDFQEDFRVTDGTYGTGEAFFGLVCQYTSSRTDRFFFDDISLSQPTEDITPPQLTQIAPFSETRVDLVFDEALDSTSAATASNYEIDQGIGQPTSVIYDPAFPQMTTLVLGTPLVNQRRYQLRFSQIADRNGNASTPKEANFTYLNIETAEPYDVIISEIMADPSPAIGLPETEFLELYNRSDKVIQLEGFFLIDPSKVVELPPLLLSPKSYVVLYEQGTADFNDLGPSLALPDFPGLSNGGDQLTLLNPDGVLINNVNYQAEWYGDNSRASGGFTLELINPDNPCALGLNWTASNDPKGGTPGQVNSVLESGADVNGPSLLRALLESPSSILLEFDEALDETLVFDRDNYSLDNNAFIQTVNFDQSAPNFVVLNLQVPLEASTIYQLTINTGLRDCLGNALSAATTTQLAIAEQLEEQDLIINEVLFDPETGGQRFVELFNRSGKVISLSDLILAGRDETGELAQPKVIELPVLLFPGEYAVITPSPEDISNRYTVANPAALIQNSVPSYNSREGDVVVYTIRGTEAIIVDEFSYSRDFHSPFLEDPEGVSLERLDPEVPTQSATNWQSAAASAGFATPTSQNSQAPVAPPEAGEVISIPNPVLSPDGDSREDFLSIFYQLREPGAVANVKIFDAEGRLVRDLVQNQLLSQEGSFKWEGETDDGDLAAVGIYIIWAELFQANGTVERIKKTCVLARQLD